MEFNLWQTSEFRAEYVVKHYDESYIGKDGDAKICIESLEQLLKFVERCKENVIIGEDDDGTFYLEVYDTYRE